MAGFEVAAEGFHSAFIFSRLVASRSEKARDVFLAAATELDLASPFSQDATATYILAHAGYAQLEATPPARGLAEGLLERVWQRVGDALFWLYHPDNRSEEGRDKRILESLTGDELLAAAYILAEIRGACAVMYWDRDDKCGVNILSAWAPQVCRIAAYGLENRDALAQVGFRPRFRSIGEELVSLLAEFGTPASVPLLQSLIDDASLGAHALRALRATNDRLIAGKADESA